MAAFGLLRKRDVNFHKKSMRVALWIALFASIAEIGAGDYQTQVEIHEQPMKFAQLKVFTILLVIMHLGIS